MKNALVAGGAGFLGSHLVGRLLNEEYKVIVIDNLITGFKENIDEYLLNPNFTFLQSDVSEYISLENTKIDLIFHFASPASPPKYLNFPIETIKANVHGTMNLIEIAKNHKAKMIYASTSEVYGDPQISPQHESYWGNVNPVGLRSVYDEAKRLGETLCSQANRAGHDICILRIFNTYGPKMDPYDGRVVSNFLRQAIKGESFTVQGDGTQTRSFCYVDDLIEGIFKFSQSKYSGPLNLGNPQEFSILELASLISKKLDTKKDIIFIKGMEDDPRQRKPDISIARKLLDWKPKVDLEEGILITCDWMRHRLN